EIEAAEARMSEAEASLAVVEAGARPADIAGIESSLSRTQLELQQSNAELASQRRLFEKHAATAVEVRAAEDKVKQLELEIQNLQKRRAALAPTSPDLAAARARLREAQIAVTAARKRAVRSVITAPMSGVIYGIAARSGAFVEAGALIANIGRLDR